MAVDAEPTRARTHELVYARVLTVELYFTGTVYLGRLLLRFKIRAIEPSMEGEVLSVGLDVEGFIPSFHKKRRVGGAQTWRGERSSAPALRCRSLVA